MKRVREQIGANSNTAIAYKGTGICVAVLDSGVSKHPDLASRILAFKDFTGKQSKKDVIYDDYGHGTHA